MNLKETFDKYKDDEFLCFDRIKPEYRLASRADLHAFNRLDLLLPGNADMVASAEHDQIWLTVAPEELEKVITEDQVLELVRCGVMYDEDTEALSMFV